jgi:hypothetical protein
MGGTMSFMTDIADLFGIRELPWVTRTFLFLTILFAVILVWAAMGGRLSMGGNPVENPNIDKLFTVSADSLKTVLGAFLGSLTTATRVPRPGDKGKSGRA